MSGDTKRNFDRVPFSMPVRINKPSAMEAMGLDLGVGGIAVHMAEPVAEGSMVEMEFFGDGNAVTGIVRKATPHDGGGFRLGIQFHEENGHLVSTWQGMAK
jgi:hypothetical protein